MAAAFDDTISSSLQCRLCSDLLSDPQQLPCTHTFCRKCLSSPPGCSSKTTAKSPVCPICQIETKVRGGMNLNLNTNIPVKSVVDDVRNGKRLCEICNKRSRQNLIFCCECGKHMCRDCLDYNCPHNHKKTVVTVRDIRERKVVPQTKVHCEEERHRPGGLDKIFTYVCTRPCKKLICKKCRLLHHTENGHTVQDAEEYNTSITAKIESLLSHSKVKVVAIKSHTTSIKSQIKRVTEHIEGEKTKLNKEYEELTNELKDRRVALQRQLEDLKDESCLELKKMKDDDEKLVASIDEKSEEANDSLKAALEGDVVAIHDSVSNELKDLLDSNYSEKKLATDVAYRAEQVKFTLGKRYEWPSISRQAFRFGFLSVFFLVLSLALFEFMSSPARSYIDLRCEVEFPQKDSMNFMTASPDGNMMAVGYWTGGIAFYSADGQLQQTVLKDVKIIGIGFLSDGRCVVIKNWDEITLYTSTWEQLDVRFESLQRGSISVTVDGNDLIFVGYEKADKIQVFSPAGGEAIREIPFNRYQLRDITSYGDFFLIELYDDAVIIIDNKGNIKHELSEPVYACVSDSNSVLIASLWEDEGSLTIDEYTNELKHMRTLISDFKIEICERNWYYLQQFRSGEIAFCTTDRLYIFNLRLDNGISWFVQVNPTK